MCIYQLPEENVFPDPDLAREDGLLAIGGDLTTDRLLNAYCNGIFPWFNEGEPILWWSPDPRMVIEPHTFKVSKSLKQTIRNKGYEQKIDSCFEDVIRECADTIRKDQDGTWITNEIQDAYINLHKAGFAHSFETFKDGELVGGLYGVMIGRVFFGESMFHKTTDASKTALVSLKNTCISLDIPLIDCQQETPHLKSMGAITISRKDFVSKLSKLCFEKPQFDREESTDK